MRKRLALLTVSMSVVAACGGPQQSAHSSPAPIATVAIDVPEAGPPAAPPLPAEPAGLVTLLKAPASSCPLSGNVTEPMTLAMRDAGSALVRVRAGALKTALLGSGEAFAEVATSSFSVRGFAAKGGASVRAARWFSFGGVLFPGSAYKLTVAGGGVIGGTTSRPSPSLRQGATTVTGRLPPEVIQRIVRQNFGRFRLCYEQGLRTDPKLSGRVIVKFEIDPTGAVQKASDGGSDLPSATVVSCVVRGFGNMSFPQPESGLVNVVYPIIFAPAAP